MRTWVCRDCQLTSYRMRVRPIWPPSASMVFSSARTSLGEAPEEASLRTRLTGAAAISAASAASAASLAAASSASLAAASAAASSSACAAHHLHNCTRQHLSWRTRLSGPKVGHFQPRLALSSRFHCSFGSMPGSAGVPHSVRSLEGRAGGRTRRAAPSLVLRISPSLHFFISARSGCGLLTI